MSLQKIVPLAENAALLDLQSLDLEVETVKLLPVASRLALPNRIAVVGNYLPRRCGIATFTTDSVRRPARGIRHDGASGVAR